LPAAHLTERGIVTVAGDDARRFLNNLVTADMTAVSPAKAGFGALLTPQGKIIADFFVAEDAQDGSFFLDCPAALAATLATRLTFYKLRAKIAVADASNAYDVWAVWDGAAPPSGLVFSDPRWSTLGQRSIVPAAQRESVTAAMSAQTAAESAYDAHRIACGIPRGGIDFAYGDTFPHEADMDQLSGVDFEKGCYIGQEVVSRVEHRGTARARVVPVAFDDLAPPPGTLVTAGEKEIGTLGSAAAGRALALLRLDRAADARAQGVPLTAGGVTLRVLRPEWASPALLAKLDGAWPVDPTVKTNGGS
jgi:folate-binding protein YgfZ